MSCRSCKTTYLAAKKGHVECVLDKVEWHKRTLCGAIMSGNRGVYERIRRLDKGRAVPSEVVLAAAEKGWVDVVADNYDGPYGDRFLLKLMASAMSSGSSHMCDFVCTNYMRDFQLTLANYKSLLVSAIGSKSIPMMKWFKDTFGWWVDYIDGEGPTLYECAVMTNDVTMMEYLWPYFDVQMHRGAMYHWYLQSALKRPQAFRFLIDKCDELGIRVPAELKDQVLWYPKFAFQNIVLLYRNNNEWGRYFKYALEDELREAGPRTRVIFERIKDYAEYHGLHADRTDDILGEIRHLIGDVEETRGNPVNINILMTYIDAMDMPEGRYIEVCELMKKLYEAMKK